MSLRNIKVSQLARIMELARGAHTHMNRVKCTESVLNMLSQVLGTELGSVMLVDDEKKELFIERANGLEGHIVRDTRVKIGEGIAGWVAKTGKPLLIKDLSKDARFKRFRKAETARYATESLLSVPLKIGQRVIGVINVNNKKTKKIFTRKDLFLLTFIADYIALAIHNAVVHEEAKRQVKLKLDFLSEISHELKNPLTSIKESVSMVLEGLGGFVDKKKARMLEIALKNINRLNKMVSSLLELARLEAKKAHIHRTYLDLKKLIGESVDFNKTPAKLKGIKIKAGFMMRYSKIWADYDKLIQVINNLLSNAIKFTEKGGRIDITVKEKDKDVFIAVQDTGRGISKEDLPKLFNKFERIGEPAEKTEGTGLGLAICKEIIDMHKGRIWAESVLHKGSRFNILLPRDIRKGERG